MFGFCIFRQVYYFTNRIKLIFIQSQFFTRFGLNWPLLAALYSLRVRIRYDVEVCACVLTCLRNGQYELIMRWWSSKPQSGIATVLDYSAYCYVILPRLP